jgi:predicted transcriptional regulator
MIVTKEIKNECVEKTDTLTIELPCQMIERIEKYAQKHENSVSGILLEALDTFLRKQT